MKKQSKLIFPISVQLTIAFLICTVGVLLGCWITNRTFIVKYYTSQMESTLIEAYQSLEQVGSEEKILSDDFLVYLKRLSSEDSIGAIVLDSNSHLLVSTINNPQELTERLWEKMFGNQTDSSNAIYREASGKYVIQISYDERVGMDYMEMWGILPDNCIFMMRTAMAGIEKSARFANRFLAIVGLIGMGIATIVMSIMSRTLTKPIHELVYISDKMSNLDFETKYLGSGRTEISELGNNINILSEKLEKTISELKNANNELRQDIEKREKIDEMRNEFLSNVSHELKTPIALVQGYAEGLQVGIDDDSESREYYCEVIIEEAHKMNDIVKKLMDLNQLEFGHDAMEWERFDLTELINNYLQSVDILAKQYGVKVRLSSEESRFVWGDEVMIEDVVGNYVSNALHHVKGEKVIHVKISNKSADNLVRVSVFNSGDPIPEESIPHLFEKFYKVDKARTREYGGSGVGLSIVKAIMDKHGREYGVINYDNGVEFWFELATE